MKIREYTFEDAEAHAEVHRESVRGIASEDYRDEIIEAWASKETEDTPLPEEKVRLENGTNTGRGRNGIDTRDMIFNICLTEYLNTSNRRVPSQLEEAEE